MNRFSPAHELASNGFLLLCALCCLPLLINLQEGFWIDSESKFRNRKLANVKNRNVLGTECNNRQLSQHNRTEKKNEPFRSVPRSISKALCDVSLRLSRVLEFQSSSPPASGAFIKCFPFLFLFLSFSLLSFPICFLDGMEKAYSQIALLPVHFHFRFLSLS